ncbi:MAG: D-aminoacylase [Oscillospiraceae bacterium]|nr:D-aminoacylase [Oscillospiraceae bacterium]
MTYDLIIRGGTVVDGTNRPPFPADLFIKDGRIAAIGKDDGAEAARVIDAAGKIVSPGFVDIHTHSDICPLVPYLPESKIYQGVTSELGGNCGISILPCSDERRAEIEKYCASELEIPMLDTRIVTYTTRAYDEYIKARPTSSNYGMLVGHGTLRGCIMGFEDRDPSAEELEAMRERLDREMSEGAFGLSLGLAYPPSCFAKTEELVSLAQIVAKHDGILAVHMRDETSGVLDSVREMIHIAERTGVHVQISHLKIMQKTNWHLADEELALIDGANARGLRITCDQYPYTASALALSAFLPHWAHDGGMEAMMERVHHPTAQMLAEMDVKLEGRGGPKGIVICSTRGIREDWEGMTIEAIAASLGLDHLQAVLEILKTCGTEVFVITFAQDEGIVRRIFCRDDMATASDGHNLSLDPEITKDKLHPRNFGTFPHAIEWARDEKLLPLETVIYKITGLPAKMMGLTQHGTLEVGKVADVTIFDHAKVADRSTYSDPMQKPEGIETVIVAGEVILEAGKITDARPGRALLFGRD